MDWSGAIIHPNMTSFFVDDVVAVAVADVADEAKF